MLRRRADNGRDVGASQKILAVRGAAIAKQTTLKEAVHLELDCCRKDDWRQMSQIAAQRP